MTVKYPLLTYVLRFGQLVVMHVKVSLIMFFSVPNLWRNFVSFVDFTILFKFIWRTQNQRSYYQGYTFLLNYLVHALDWCLKEQGQIWMMCRVQKVIRFYTLHWKQKISLEKMRSKIFPLNLVDSNLSGAISLKWNFKCLFGILRQHVLKCLILN